MSKLFQFYNIKNNQSFSNYKKGLQNLGNTKLFCIGDFECDVNNTWIIIFFKFIYIIFWTFILNLLCKNIKN